MGKTVLITGGTSGIGKETALGLARTGATIVIVGRNREKTERVENEIRLATGNERIQHYLCDLASLAEVRKLAASAAENSSAVSARLNALVAAINLYLFEGVDKLTEAERDKVVRLKVGPAGVTRFTRMLPLGSTMATM